MFDYFATMTLKVDFAASATIANPFPVLRVLQEHDPVHWHEPMQSWCLTQFKDITWAYNDQRFSADRVRPFVARQQNHNVELDELGECISLWMVFNDPPMHTRLRKLTQQAFTRRALEKLRPSITQLVNELINGFCQGQDNTVDFVKAFAYPLPANVIADLLGVPREHVEDLKRWSDDLAQFVLSSRIQPDKYQVAATSLRQMNALFAELIAERRHHPGDKIMDDLIAAYDSDDTLDHNELIAFCVLLLFAGHETTTHFFSNGLRALLLHPEQMSDLCHHLDDAYLVNNALSEMLRWDGPIVAISRLLTADVELQGRLLSKDARVYLFNAAANRDPKVFPNPDEFNIRRRQANKMITFGYGIHLCLGVHLARLEAEIAFPIILRRLQEMQLVSDHLEWADTLVIRGPKTLPISFCQH